MEKPRIGVVISTTRQGRFADKPVDWLLNIARMRNDLSFERIDLRDYPLPLFDQAMSPMYKPSDNEVAQRLGKKVSAMSGFIFVTAEYNHSIPGALKNAIDHLYQEWNRKPAAFVGYGGVGAARAIEQLRAICIEMEMAPLRSGVHIGLEPFLAVMKGGKSLSDFDFLNKSVTAMLDELSWWANALASAREKDLRSTSA